MLTTRIYGKKPRRSSLDINKIKIGIYILLIIFPKAIIFMCLIRRRLFVNIGVIQFRSTALRLLQDRGILINVSQLKFKLPALPDTKQVSRPRSRISSDEMKKPSFDLFSTCSRSSVSFWLEAVIKIQ